jgi:hypothetical protein
MMEAALNHRRRKLVFLVLALVVPAGMVVLYTFPPTADSFYPRCVTFWLTGLHCPGCGTARALHALLHGNLLQAAAYNLPVLIVLPLLVVESVRYGWSVWTQRSYRTLRAATWMIYVIFALMLVYFVLRNIPVEPFTLLAPHEIGAAQP